MPRKKRRQSKVGEPFTAIPESWFRYLHESRASAVEICVLLALLQHPQRNGLLSRPVSDYGDGHDKSGIVTATGIRKDQVTRALSNLCNKRVITLPDGTTTPVLTPVVKGHRGRVAVYRCNLPRTNKTSERPRATKAHEYEKDGSTAAQSTTELDGGSANTVKARQPYHLQKTGGAGKDQPTPPWLR